MTRPLSSLSVGSLVKDVGTTYNGKSIIWKIIDKNHAGYPANSVTLMSDKIITLKCFDAEEGRNSDINRQDCGNNRYIYSNIRSWLNSNSDKGKWYSPKHADDSSPSYGDVWNGSNAYRNKAGFLKGFSTNLANCLLTTSITATRATIDGGGVDSCSDKVFLPSCTEMGISVSGNAVCGKKFPNFGSYANKGYLTQECIDENDFKAMSLSISKPHQYWVRDSERCNSARSTNVSVVGNGESSNSYVGTIGVRPIFNVPSSVIVSDTKDSDGAYSMVWNRPPSISGSNKNLGLKTSAFSQNYTITDLDSNQTITVTEKIDNIQKRKFVATSGQSYSFSVTANEFLKLLNGSHTLTITATDNVGGTTTRHYTFSKNETEIELTLAKPLASDDFVTKAIMSVTKEISAGAIFTVEVCNNGNDISPAWENVTHAITSNNKFFLKNKVKTASKWGFNFRIKVKRNKSGDCFISAVGGNFE